MTTAHITVRLEAGFEVETNEGADLASFLNSEDNREAILGAISQAITYKPQKTLGWVDDDNEACLADFTFCDAQGFTVKMDK